MTDQTKTEAEKVAKAMAALDTMATMWAAGFDIRKAVNAMKSLPDGDDRLIAFIKQAHCEGLYSGRTSLQAIAQPAHAMELSDSEAKQLLEQSDLLDMFRHIGWYSAPESGFKKHGMTLIKKIEIAINSKKTKGEAEGIAQPVQPAFDLEALMSQAQIFASAWSLAGGRFDSGGGFEQAKNAKNELKHMLNSALAAAPDAALSQPVQPADNCKLLAEIEVLREALKSNEQCVTDFIEVYKRGASMLFMDEAVKSLRDDGLKLARAALANKQGA